MSIDNRMLANIRPPGQCKTLRDVRKFNLINWRRVCSQKPVTYLNQELVIRSHGRDGRVYGMLKRLVRAQFDARVPGGHPNSVPNSVGHLA